MYVVSVHNPPVITVSEVSCWPYGRRRPVKVSGPQRGEGEKLSQKKQRNDQFTPVVLGIGDLQPSFIRIIISHEIRILRF